MRAYRVNKAIGFPKKEQQYYEVVKRYPMQ